MKAKMINTIRPEDKLTEQFYGNETQIRANMTGLTGSGVLIATLPATDHTVDPAFNEAIYKEVNRILELEGSQSKCKEQ